MKFGQRVLVAAGLAAAGAAALAQEQHDCLMEPNQVVEVGSPASGLLERVTVKRGDRVSQGQVLAVLDNRAENAAAQLAKFKSEAQGPSQTARNKMEYAQRKLQRRKEMAAEKLGSVQERDDAEAEVALAKSELLSAEESRQLAKIEFEQQSGMLALRTVRSPFDGVVVDQMLYPGEILDGAGKKAVLKLAQLDPLRVRMVFPMQLFDKVKAGTAVEIAPELPSVGKLAAKVTSVDRLVDAASGTFTAFAVLPNKQLGMPSGLRCKVKVAGR